MLNQFTFIDPALLIKTEQLVSPSRGLKITSCRQLNHQAGNQRAVDLNLDTTLTSTHQMTAREYTLQPAKEELDQPAEAIQLHDYLCGNVQQVGDNDQFRIFVWLVNLSFGMARQLHDDPALKMIWVFDALRFLRAHLA